jgi:hypothetical protein
VLSCSCKIGQQFFANEDEEKGRVEKNVKPEKTVLRELQVKCRKDFDSIRAE